MAEDNVLIERIELRLVAVKMSARAASMAAGMGPDGIRNIRRGKSESPRGKNLQALADVLLTTPEYLLGRTDNPSPRRMPSDVADNRDIIEALPPSMRAPPMELGEADLPILGSARGGANGILIIAEGAEPVDHTYRPPQLMNVKDAFAIYAYGDSMHPMFREGHILWIHPHAPLLTGEGVLIVKNNDEAMFKEYVSQDTRALSVREYKPKPRVFKIAWAEIRRTYRILGSIGVK